MLVVFKKVKQDNVLVFDAEYNEGELIQFSGVLFRKIETDIFQISKSLNVYVKLENGFINRFIRQFTGITDLFLQEYGIPLNEAIEQINDLIKCNGSILFVSHGLTNDRRILFENGVNFYGDGFEEQTAKLPGVCTYNMARKVLKREINLSLAEIAAEAGVFLSNDHNAFDDTWATIAIFSLLCKLANEKRGDEKNE